MNDIRQKFWTEVYLAYVRGTEQPFAALAALRADEALHAFDERFSSEDNMRFLVIENGVSHWVKRSEIPELSKP